MPQQGLLPASVSPALSLAMPNDTPHHAFFAIAHFFLQFRAIVEPYNVLKLVLAMLFKRHLSPTKLRHLYPIRLSTTILLFSVIAKPLQQTLASSDSFVSAIDLQHLLRGYLLHYSAQVARYRDLATSEPQWCVHLQISYCAIRCVKIHTFANSLLKMIRFFSL